MTLLASLLLAAQITTVATAGDARHALELDLDASYVHQRAETRITREGLGGTLTDELHHLSTLDEVALRLDVGLWHDLELHVIAPYVVREQQNVRFYNAPTSTLASNRIDVSGCGTAHPCTAPAPIVAGPLQTKRQGFRDPTIGLAWAPVNEARELQLDPAIYPRGGGPSTWVVGVDLTLGLPITVDDPSRFGAAASPAAPDANTVARRTHVLTAWTAFSKRFQVAEPYLRVSGSVPFARKDAYDNCAHPELLSDVAAANCAGPWKGETGYAPGIEAALTLGTELVLLESPYGDARFALDVRGDARYHGPGRDYTQVTDALGKLTYRDEFMTLGSSVGAYARVGSSFRLGVYATAGFDTAHTLTREDLGEDKDSVPGVQVSGGSGKPAPDQNPNFDYRLDPAGRRLHAEANFIWGLSGQLAVIF